MSESRPIRLVPEAFITDGVAQPAAGQVVTWDTEGAKWKTPASSGQPALVRTAVKSGNYVAVAQDYVAVDATSANPQITLPTAPANGAIVGVRQILVGVGHSTSVVTAGSDVFSRTAGPTSATLTLAGQTLIVQYDSSTAIWSPIGTDLPLSQLLASPAFTGTPTAPTAAVGDNTTQLATDAFVQAAVASVRDAAPAISGAVYRTVSANPTVTNVVNVLNKAYGRRIALSAGTLDRIMVEHAATTGAGETMRLGIYNDSGGRPGSLLLDAGTVDLSTATALKSITIAQVLTSGFYWLVAVHQGGAATALVRTFGNNAGNAPALDIGGSASWVQVDTAAFNQLHANVMTVATATSGFSSALPTPFGTATMSYASPAADGCPVIGVRYA